MPVWPPPPQVIFVLIIMGLILFAGIAYSLLSLARFLAYRRAGVNPFEEEEEEGDDDRTKAERAERWVELRKTPETHQAEPIEPSVREPSDEPFVSSHKLGRKSLTLLLAAQKDDEGKYLYSANKIAEFIGGTSAEVKGWVADVRGRKEPAAASLKRPANGWR